MRIALIAHDSRKELMAQFCTAYVRILSENELIATGVTGKVVREATGLPVHCLYAGARGGAEQIAAMIACGEVDMLLFFRDPVGARPDEPNAVTLLRLCDMHTIRWLPTSPRRKCSSTGLNAATLPGLSCSALEREPAGCVFAAS